MSLTEKKLENGKKAGANFLCTACPYCQMQFDTVQKEILSIRGTNNQLPSLLYPQLLGLSMGIEKDLLGLKMNDLPVEGIEDFFTNLEQKEMEA